MRRASPGFEKRGPCTRLWGAHNGAHRSHVGAFCVQSGATPFHIEITERVELQR